MDSARYREHATQANAFGRVELTDTATALESIDANLAQRVRALLEQPPIPKPERHSGGPDTDIFRVEFSAATVEAIVEALGAAEVGKVGMDGRTTREASHLATLLDAWLRYSYQLDENA